MKRPRLLDLFCCAGVASVGYQRAGFDVTGVDIAPQPDYPAEFVQDDALEYLATADLSRYDAIHASPPCQASTTMSNRWRGQGGRADEHVNLIAPTRDALNTTGLPWVMENVAGARKSMPNALALSGGMFGLGVDRVRLFESNVLLFGLPSVKVKNPLGVYGKHHDGRRLWTRADGSEQRAPKTLEQALEAMGVDWYVPWNRLKEAIPPAYTQFIGEQLLAYVTERAA